MIPVLNARQMRAADQAAIRSGVPSAVLMENAARELVRALSEAYPGWRRVVVSCGPGNNGGDGLVAARMLLERGVSVSVFTLGDPSAYKGDAASNAARAREAGVELVEISSPSGFASFQRAAAESDGLVDALFGTGLSRRLEGLAARAVSGIKESRKPVVAADVPSGLSSESGELIGPCVRADLTVAFGAPKHCHVFFPARERCGRLVVADIGIARELLLRQERKLQLLCPEDVQSLLPPRRADSHKGDFGRVAIIAGSRGKAGASILAARGALRAGAGLVTVFCPESLEATVVAALPEAMTRALPEERGGFSEKGARNLGKELRQFDAAVAGPGVGLERGTVAFLEGVLKARLPLVCDADFLNAFAGRPGRFRRRKAPTILTPHPGEAGRLLGISSRDVQGDRPAAAQRLSRRTGAVVLLKGAASLTATPEGDLTVNPSGTPLLATAGAGDVLAGAIGALLAVGLRAAEAAYTAAFLHGAAGERVARALGDAGLLAGELADALPRVRRALHA